MDDLYKQRITSGPTHLHRQWFVVTHLHHPLSLTFTTSGSLSLTYTTTRCHSPTISGISLLHYYCSRAPVTQSPTMYHQSYSPAMHHQWPTVIFRHCTSDKLVEQHEWQTMVRNVFVRPRREVILRYGSTLLMHITDIFRCMLYIIYMLCIWLILYSCA
jgi:hypothetical protein